eukprot:jgi/Tetstr1/461870/TSEL_006949.t2
MGERRGGGGTVASVGVYEGGAGSGGEDHRRQALGLPRVAEQQPGSRSGEREQREEREGERGERGEPPLGELLQVLQLQSLSEEEIRKAFDLLDLDGNGRLSEEEVEAVMAESLGSAQPLPGLVRGRTRDFMQTFDVDSDGMVTLDEFSTKLRAMSKRLDRRAWPLAICVGIVAMTASMIHPELGLSLSQYGLTTSIYGVAKTVVALPAAILQDTAGRLPVITASLVAMSVGFAGVGLSPGFFGFAASRAAVGSGVSSWGLATTTYALDISHPLNRARSMAPLSTCTAIGGILGSMMGGYIADAIGLHRTFLVVGCIFAVVVAAANTLLSETRRGGGAPPKQPGKGGRPGLQSLASFSSVMRQPGVPALVGFNCANRLCVGTAKMTLLPLFLAGTMGMAASTIGTVFAIMSAVALVFVQPAAYLSDHVGHKRVIPPTGIAQGAALVVLACSGICESREALLALGISMWAIAHTLLGSSVYAHVSGVVPYELRSPACGVIRVSGDITTIFGGVAFGVLAQQAGVTVALGIIGSLQVLAAAWFLLDSRYGGRPGSSEAEKC